MIRSVSPLFRAASCVPAAQRAILCTPAPSSSLLLQRSSFSTSSSTGDSHHGAATSHAHEDPHQEEGFASPIWRNSALAVLATVLLIRLYPNAISATEDVPHPITTYLAHQMPATDLWKGRNAKHLQLAKEAADDRLLFQEAERPRVKRMRYLGTFEQASPNGIAIGSQADLTNLRIKSEKEDFGSSPAAGDDEE